MSTKKPAVSKAIVVSSPIESALDQPLSLPALPQVLEHIDQTFEQAKRDGEAELAFQLVDKLATASSIVGPALARALWLISHNWDVLGQGIEVPFEEFALHRFGKEKDTIRRYIQTADFHDSVEKGKKVKTEVKDALKSLPMAAQVRVAQHYREHGALPAEHLKKLSQASSTTEVVDLLKGFRGEPETNGKSPNGIHFVISPEKELLAWVSDGESGDMVRLGILRADDAQDENTMRAFETMKKRLHAEEK